MKEVAALGNEDFVLGFQLAGISKAIIMEKQPDSTVRELMEHSDIGLIIIQEESLKSLSEDMREIVSESIAPVFLTMTEEDTNEEMRKLIKKSIGVDLWNK